MSHIHEPHCWKSHVATQMCSDVVLRTDKKGIYYQRGQIHLSPTGIGAFAHVLANMTKVFAGVNSRPCIL